MASGNVIYPLLINSFKDVYTNLTGQFFRNSGVRKRVFAFHRELVRTIEAGDGNGAVSVMKRILVHGEEYLRREIGRTETAGEEGRAV
jgi:DNA-binding FadR family transcriptional regulator